MVQVVKNLHANAGDTGLIPGLGGCRMRQPSRHATTPETVLPGSTREAPPREACTAQPERALPPQGRPSTAKTS